MPKHDRPRFFSGIYCFLSTEVDQSNPTTVTQQPIEAEVLMVNNHALRITNATNHFLRNLVLLAAISSIFAGCIGRAHANLLEGLVAGNLSATNATISFRSTTGEGVLIPTTAVLQWGKTEAYGNQTSLQYSSDSKPDNPVTGLRALYIDDLTPASTYHWKIRVQTEMGSSEEKTGNFTTLPVDTSKKRGPSGKHIPPHTPAYTTPATHIATDWTQINVLLTKCQGGEVIEVADDVTDDSKPVVLNRGNESWATNVLIRPPLGKRSTIRSLRIEINSPHITVAGFNLKSATMYPKYGNHRGNANGIGARRAFFWMCTLDRDGTLLANGCPDSGWYEVVALRRGVGGDRAQIKVFADIAPNNFTIAGCWLEGKDRTNGKDHSDTLQTLGTRDIPITGLKMIDTVFFRSANCSGQLTFLKGTLIQNCWFGPLVGRSQVNGSYYATLGACDESTIRNSDWNGPFRQDANPKEITNSSFHKLAQPGEISQGNKIGVALQPQPPLPDTNAIWPR
jgi:hypothetical protein